MWGTWCVGTEDFRSTIIVTATVVRAFNEQSSYEYEPNQLYSDIFSTLIPFNPTSQTLHQSMATDVLCLPRRKSARLAHHRPDHQTFKNQPALCRETLHRCTKT